MKRILIVEDDVAIAKALAVRFKGAGYEVMIASDGVAGTALAINKTPDVVLLDVSMPAGGGFTIAERMRDNVSTISVPFIFLTASKRPDVREQAEELGCAAFFEKPYDFAALYRAVDGVTGTGALLKV